jgi:hypothetical protein
LTENGVGYRLKESEWTQSSKDRGAVQQRQDWIPEDDFTRP